MSQRVRIKRHPERAVPHEAAAILCQGSVAHVGFVQDGGPFVIPFMYQYSADTPDRLYLHGARASRAMRHFAGGEPVCVEVTLLDGLVYSRTAESHSANYRSVVVFGRTRIVGDETLKRTLFDGMTRRYFPDRTLGRDYQPVASTYLATTTLVEVIIDEWNAKARRGPPLGPLDADPTAPGTAGVVTTDCSG
jgi:nitroimidazol reductase NimA-like FMN-containing flavoprotein (pyridoxamine 5'-phosphate oxidase superfamily)